MTALKRLTADLVRSRLARGICTMAPMLRRALKRLTRRSSIDRKVLPSGIEMLEALNDDPSVDRYPPFARGIAATPPERLLKAQEPTIRAIEHASRLDHPTFNRVLWPVLANLAHWVHLLPASESHHHRIEGGLFRHSLEVGLFALNAAEGIVFVPTGTPYQRRVEEPRWRAALGIAGMLHDIGKPASDVTVTDAAGERWDPHGERLASWLERNRIERYYVTWHHDRGRRHELFASTVLHYLVPDVTRGWLSEINPKIVGHMLATVVASESGTHFAQLVYDADRRSVERDMRASTAPQAPGIGVPIERHVLDTMRRLVATGGWTANEPGARVWLVADGVFVAWEAATRDIVNELKKDKIPGVPRTGEALGEMLIERGHAQPRVLDDGRQYPFWPVQPACIGDGTVILKSLKLTSPELLWPDSEPPAPVAARVGTAAENATTTDLAEPGDAATNDTLAKAQAPTTNRSTPTRPERATAFDNTHHPRASTDTAPAAGEGGDNESEVTDEQPVRLTVVAPSQDDHALAPGADAEAQAGAGGVGDDADQQPVEAAEQAGEAVRLAIDETDAQAQANIEDERVTAADLDAVINELGEHGEAGVMLARLIASVRDGEQSPQQLLYASSDGVMVRYPEPVRAYTERATQAISVLKSADWLRYDTDGELKPVRTVDGVKGLVLVDWIGNRLAPVLAYDHNVRLSRDDSPACASEPDGRGESAGATITPAPTGQPELAYEAAPQPQPTRATARASHSRRRRKSTGQPASNALSQSQANEAIQRIIDHARGPESQPGRTADGQWLVIKLAQATRLGGISSSRLRLNVAQHRDITVSGGHVYVRTQSTPNGEPDQDSEPS